MPIKTLEFKLKLTQEHKLMRDSWVNGLRWVWNQGLELLENFFRFHSWDSLSNNWVPCSPIPWEYWKHNEELIPYCWVGNLSSCPIPQPYRPSLLSGNPGSKPYYWLRPYFTQRNHPDKAWFKKIPSVFVNNTLERLSKAWLRYRQGIAGKPKYRTRNTQNTTIETSQIKTRVYIEGRYIKVPGFGKLLVKGLDTRLPQDSSLKLCRICKFASGDYLQLGIEVDEKVLADSDISCGIDVGIEYLYATDHGRLVTSPRYFQRSEGKLAKLQRQLSQSQGRRYPKQVGSNNYKKSQNKVAKLHEKVARQRKAFNHWHSSNLVKIYGGISVEDVDLKELARKNASSNTSQFSGGNPSRTKIQSSFNKALADMGCGQLLLFLEQKAEEAKREFKRVDPAYTSQDCPNCGHRNLLNLRQRIFCCEKCAFQLERKHAAAKVIRQRADFERSYRGCHRDVMPVESPSKEAVKQESKLARAGTANADE